VAVSIPVLKLAVQIQRARG